MLTIILILFVLVAGLVLVNFVFSESKVVTVEKKKVEEAPKKTKPVFKPTKVVVPEPTPVVAAVVETKPKKSMKEKKEAKKQIAKTLEEKQKAQVKAEVKEKIDETGFINLKDTKKPTKKKQNAQKQPEVHKPKPLFKIPVEPEKPLVQVEKVVEAPVEKPVEVKVYDGPTVITEVYQNAEDFWGGKKIAQPKREKKIKTEKPQGAEGKVKKEFKQGDKPQGEKKPRREFTKDSEKTKTDKGEKTDKTDKKEKGDKKPFEKKTFDKKSDKSGDKKLEKKSNSTEESVPYIKTFTTVSGKSWNAIAVINTNAKSEDFPTLNEKVAVKKTAPKHEKRSDHALAGFELNMTAPEEKKVKIEEQVVLEVKEN